MSIPISVWYHNELLSNWSLKGTNDYQETKDEYKYFRVFSQGKKYFYHNSKDYFKHIENSLVTTDIDINGNYHKITEITNIKGEVIYSL
jgi:hypothetical protein